MIAKLKPANDLLVSSSMSLIDGPTYATDQIRHKLMFLKGEWAWDLDAGLPYYRDILVKGPNEALIQEIYKKAILEVPCIVAVNYVTLELDSATRILYVTFEAVYRDPETGDSTTVTGSAE